MRHALAFLAAGHSRLGMIHNNRSLSRIFLQPDILKLRADLNGPARLGKFDPALDGFNVSGVSPSYCKRITVHPHLTHVKGLLSIWDNACSAHILDSAFLEPEFLEPNFLVKEFRCKRLRWLLYCINYESLAI